MLTNTNTVTTAAVNTGPIVGLTASNASYDNQIFSVFTDFGTPAGGGIPARPGYSGVQGSDGNLLIGLAAGQRRATLAAERPRSTHSPAATTPFRRFYGIAFDQYGYFSQGVSADGHQLHDERYLRRHHVHSRQQRRRPTPAACSSATWRPACT